MQRTAVSFDRVYFKTFLKDFSKFLKEVWVNLGLGTVKLQVEFQVSSSTF